MGFLDLDIKRIYDTSTDDLVEDFFSPMLSVAKTYDRGVGYFSSGWIKINSVGLSKFAENGGHARWVTSPILSKDDWESLCFGDCARRDETLFRVLSQSIADLRTSLITDELSALAWLIADNVLDFKLAIPRNELTGEFHDKFGIFKDFSSNAISFTGSYNDSIHGTRNYESITTFKSWEVSSKEIVVANENRFERLWSNLDPNVQVYDLPESIRYQIVRLRENERPYACQSEASLDHPITPKLPRGIIIRSYQEEAVSAWLKNDCRGFFEMATGTGKTITSLLAANEIFNKYQKIAVIITCPYKHLVDQWEVEAERFNYSPIKAYESFDAWSNAVANKVIAYNKSDINSLCIITTNTTFMTERFLSVIQSINAPILLIADEAHHFGTEKSTKYFPDNVKMRLALSATPNRWYDETGTRALTTYFGDTVFSFPLKRAIEEGFLTNYYYYPINVDLSVEEVEEYSALTRMISPLYYKKSKTEADEKRLTSLLIKRSNITKNASGKMDALRLLLKDKGMIDHAIFYCSPEQREELLRFLGIEKRIKIHEFTFRENNSLRNEILNQFDNGFLQAVVAIKCLDEGVDVPSSRQAFFLASSSNPREFIQRRGRVLRKHPSKQNASLYDFIVVPPSPCDEPEFELTRNLLRKELLRFDEFAKSSLNYFSASEVIWDIAKHFNLLAM